MGPGNQLPTSSQFKTSSRTSQQRHGQSTPHDNQGTQSAPITITISDEDEDEALKGSQLSANTDQLNSSRPSADRDHLNSSRPSAARDQLPAGPRQAEREPTVVIELDSDSDEEIPHPRIQQTPPTAPVSLSPRHPYTSTPTTAPSPTLNREEATTSAIPAYRFLWDRNAAPRGSDRPFPDRSIAQPERSVAPPTRPPGFWSTFMSTTRGTQQPVASRTPQPRAQSQAQSPAQPPAQLLAQPPTQPQMRPPAQSQTQPQAPQPARPFAQTHPTLPQMPHSEPSRAQIQPEKPPQSLPQYHAQRLQPRDSLPSQSPGTKSYVPQGSHTHGTPSECPQPQGAQPTSMNGPFATNAPTESTTRPSSATGTTSFWAAFKQYSPPHVKSSPKQGPSGAKASSFPATPRPATPAIETSICDNCARGDLPCDGVVPVCTLCAQHGIACSYKNETTPTRPSKLVVSKVPGLSESHRVEAAEEAVPRHVPASNHSTETHLDGIGRSATGGSTNAIPAADDNIVLRAPHPPLTRPENRVGNTVAGQAPECLDSESDASGDYQYTDRRSVSSVDTSGLGEPIEIDLTLEAVTSFMQDLDKEIRAWHETSTQADLRQATIDARNSPGPRLDRTLQDPFKAITEQRRSAAGGKISQQPSQGKKTSVIRAPVGSFPTGAVLLPKYQAIGRVGSSILAPNRKTAKHWAYSAEDENDPDSDKKYDDFEKHYIIDFESLKAQQKCQELVWRWKPWMEETLARIGLRNTDVLYFFTYFAFETRPQDRWQQWESCSTCDLADVETRRNHFRKETFDALPRPDDQTLQLAALVARAFHNVANISLWHIAVGGLLRPQYPDDQDATAQQSNLCLICFRHHCPDHGSYEDPKGYIAAHEGQSFINDSEQDSNIRRYVTLPDRGRRDEDKRHVCGVFCVEPSLNVRGILGRQSDGTVNGDCRPPKEQVRHILADDYLCCPSCFWDVNNRRDIKASDVKFQPFLSASQKLLVDKLMPFYLNNPRGPCLISRVIKDVDCLMVFHHMIFAIFDTPHPEELSSNTFDGGGTNPRDSGAVGKKGKPLTVSETAKSADLVNRPPFRPCFHAGPCLNNPACTCAESKVHCERFCGCDQSCKRRFRGCICKAGGAKVCFEDSRCECWIHNRECDPHLCGKCGVVDVLDSSNKYRDEIRTGRCRNNRIQLGLPAPTTRAPSQVQGYGLYSRAEISMGDFIGEYTGEIISRSEADRRGTIYQLINQEYLFNLNREQEIDASKHGNKMRFMNNSQKEENINVVAKSFFCSGLIRIGLFAKRDIRAGAELLWQYGYSAERVKFFWEPGEKPVTARALIPFSNERVARTAGKNKPAGGETLRRAQDKSTPSPTVHRGQKRKRQISESPEQDLGETVADSSEELDADVDVDVDVDVDKESSADSPLQVPETDDSADSDYVEPNGRVFEEGDTDDDDGGGGGVKSDEEEAEADTDAVPPTTGLKRGIPRTRTDAAAANGAESPRSQGRAKGRSKAKAKGKGNPEQRQRPAASADTATSTHDDDAQSGTRSRGRSDANSTTTGPSHYETDHRRRPLRPNDKRLGGRSQQRAWETRKRNNAMAHGAR
ncbi:hypothetical protein G647_01623 [Cladophialophora carrionii CBS 160.54]|uniref:SET domain-containing protein n=1 Tax=Cladophialophora carrionii CBS 160.54 TaxID=1279043 RepID=V9DQK5_9EURO|nr:uncharacterized protein G647_01623 [Cladophialophora carrionii CBS 160.54]ETI29170.1 hypothetical protein G647_01623 [Cladophialophora carrionii CBS 160.54]